MSLSIKREDSSANISRFGEEPAESVQILSRSNSSATTPSSQTHSLPSHSQTNMSSVQLVFKGEDLSIYPKTQTLSLDHYVQSKGGNRPISRVLIANNGIAAVKCIRSIRRWAYETFGNDRVIEFVAMATPEDLKANANYIHLADEFVQVPGGTNNNNYANIHLIVEIAERTNCHAVWAGWGHASENPKLPEALSATKNKIVWIGPPPDAMRALGDKIGSTLIAQSAGVPCMPWSGSGLLVDYKQSGMPKDIYRESCVYTTQEALAAAEKIGYPIMIKASEGGGGKGIRRVERSEDVELAFAQVQGEVPGSPIFLMKLAPACRHLEVQLLADTHGDAIAIFGRDCSIQRRHQKIIEEGPVVAAPPEVWHHMEQSAVRLAKEVSYVGAGTVEYLYMEDGSYCFLELNPRLQVEHPVTELISGVNLPAAQLQVAMGIPLSNIRGIRKMYGQSPDTDTPINFETAKRNLIPAHVIACRITAENPDSSFQPTSGVIQELNFRSTPDVWGYFSVSAKGGVHEYSDSQFGHMFALGETREIARRNMVLALKELSIRGDIRTTVEYLRQILETDDFKKNRLSTTWLEKVLALRAVSVEKPPAHLVAILGAIFRAHKVQSKLTKEYLEMLGRGQLPSPALHNDLIDINQQLIYEGMKYIFHLSKSGPNSYTITLNGSWACQTEIHVLADEGILVLLDGKKHVIYGQEFPSGLRLTVDGKTCLFNEEYDPTQLRSAMAGKLVRFLAADGAHVLKGKPYAELEVMKMYITLTAPEDGVIKHVKPEGSILEAGDLMATLVLDKPERIQRAELFTGTFPAFKPPFNLGESVNAILKNSVKRLQMLLGGYQLTDDEMRKSVEELMHALRSPLLPLEQCREVLSTIISRIPETLADKFTDILERYAKNVSTNRFAFERPEEFPVLDLQDAMDQCLLSQVGEEQKSKLASALNLSGIHTLLSQYKDGSTHTYAVHILTQLWEEFCTVEEKFVQDRPEHVIKELRYTHKDNLQPVVHTARSHHQLARRNTLVVMLLDIVESQLSPLLADFLPILKRLSNLNNALSGSVVLKSRQLIMRTELPPSEKRRIAIETILTTASSCGPEQRKERLAPLIDQSQPIEDVIFPFFENKRGAIQQAAMEAYIRRVFQVYSVPSCEIVPATTADGFLAGRWSFCMDQSNSRFNHTNASLTSSAAVAAMAESEDGSPISHPSSPIDTSSSSTHPHEKQRNGSIITSGRQQQTQYFLAKCDSVPNLDKLRADKPSGSDVGKVDENVDSSEEDEDATVSSGAQDASAAKPSSTRTRARVFSDATPAVDARQGVMLYTKDGLDGVKRHFAAGLKYFDASSQFSEPIHVLYIACKWSGKMPADDQLASYLRTFVLTQEAELVHHGIRRVTFIVTQGKEEHPAYFTFRHRFKYEEDTLIRHIEPCYALHMQLQRLCNFDLRFVPTTSRMVHLFAAYPAKEAGKGVTLHGPTANAMKERKPVEGVYDGRRLFVRTLVRKLDGVAIYQGPTLAESDLDNHPETEFAFVEALNALELAMGSDTRFWRYNSIFLNVLVEAVIEVKYIEAVIRLLARRYASKIKRLNVSHVEFTICIKNDVDSSQSTIYRFISSNPTGYILVVDTYLEVKDPETGKIVFKAIRTNATPTAPLHYSLQPLAGWDGLEVSTPYPINLPFQKQRQIAELMDTVYVYDFLPILSHAISKLWQLTSGQRRARSSHMPWKRESYTLKAEREAAFQELKQDEKQVQPSQVLEYVELVLAKNADGSWRLEESLREPGKNDIGMVAFKLKIWTPEFPAGRELVLIANDITHQAGTFGPLEDVLFDLASKYARQRRLPRLYFAANSGARIGLAEELRHRFKAAWLDDNNLKGLEYLYLTPEDYQELKDSVNATLITHQGEQRYVITDIIGKKDGLGVENLRGSGTIAGETSLAYEDIFTLTYVTSRTVGIGAYLARLGQRVIQKGTNPIILTGFNALNKLLGKQVYTSNVQLGGPEIMYTNGVTHLTVQDDMEGVLATLNWLSYVPQVRHGQVPLLLGPSVDPVDRAIDFVPGKMPYDPRAMLAGTSQLETGKWLSGFFDRDSWTELLAGWARSVVVGRARLGGIPMGVIAVETRTMEQIIPADPATADSKETAEQRAGQVWFPDSAYKTAQGIKDMMCEDLPLIVFANWRGFSGGMKDMLQEVLKFGSYIVDALRVYQQPVFVYLPPLGTLRGGAWVVVDSTINPQYMEMYADPTARGGVLETEGTLDVKFRKKDIIAQAHRLDDVLMKLDEELKSFEEKEKQGLSVSSALRTKEAILKDIKAREELLFPLYHQVATQFADLHDTPGRMTAKGCLHGVVEWKNARRFFYWRLQRRLAEMSIHKKLQYTQPIPEDAVQQTRTRVAAWIASVDSSISLHNDEAVATWLQKNQVVIQSFVDKENQQTTVQQVKQLLFTRFSPSSSTSSSTVTGLVAVIQSLSEEEKQALKRTFM